jgi:P-type conjugative transfer protein TrbJ
MKKLIASILVFSTLSNVPIQSNAGGGAAPVGATEVTQLLNNTELLAQSYQMYEQVQQGIQQITMAQQQLKNLIAAPQMVWGAAQAELAQLNAVIQRGRALGYQLANIDQAFTLKFPGFSRARSMNFQEASREWNQTSLDSIKSALTAAGLQSDQFATEEATLNMIQGVSAGAPGALQAVQAGVMVASQQVNQLQKLRQLFMSQMQAQNAFMAAQEQRTAEHQMINEQFFRTHQERPSTFSSRGGTR